MDLLYSQEEIWELDRRDVFQEGMEKGIEKGREQGIEQGREQGREEGMFRALKSLIETTRMPVEQAMAALQIVEKDRPQYLDMLRSIGQ